MITATNARLEKALNKMFRYSEGVMTRREHIEKYVISFDKKEVRKYEYNRRKFNNMGYAEQAEYEKKLGQMKTIYVGYSMDGAYYELPKIVFEHYTTK